MKETIINILIFVLFFNLIMIIFPEGKTQKYCKLVIKLFLFIYILNSIVLKGAVSLDDIININVLSDEASQYTREFNLNESNEKFIELINNDLYNGREVIQNIKVDFTVDMQLTVNVYLNKSLSVNEEEYLKLNIAKIFNINSENVKITF
ncbi:hypothetical protein JYG23_05060 [Sedimentibacter sp. zth1]|uniref:stage III sporulation protein AF n=1 Tax=Sedimentibacter sp. zth1 TaxID=2816908 RepID=UPI001A91A270|nr:stage III sporulation protein AF [Sedimentibacter sp. zth1]QSX06821.1 hypothetical protein JYG23_05060 [Sedimentibacter sp. zth1]